MPTTLANMHGMAGFDLVTQTSAQMARFQSLPFMPSLRSVDKFLEFQQLPKVLPFLASLGTEPLTPNPLDTTGPKRLQQLD